MRVGGRPHTKPRFHANRRHAAHGQVVTWSGVTGRVTANCRNAARGRHAAHGQIARPQAALLAPPALAPPALTCECLLCTYVWFGGVRAFVWVGGRSGSDCGRTAQGWLVPPPLNPSPPSPPRPPSSCLMPMCFSSLSRSAPSRSLPVFSCQLPPVLSPGAALFLGQHSPGLSPPRSAPSR